MAPSSLGLADQDDLSDLRVDAVSALLPPSCVVEELPGDPTTYAAVIAARENLLSICSAQSDKMVVVLQPAEVSDDEQILAVARDVQAFVAKGFGESFGEHAQLQLVLQPVTASLVGDDGPSNPRLRRQRHLLLQVNRLGVPTAADFQDTVTPQYCADLVSWASVSAQSEMLRELVSGLSMPVGLCAEAEHVADALGALEQSATGHHFLGVSAEGLCGIVESTGNCDTQAVVRLSSSSTGTQSAVEKLLEATAHAVLARPGTPLMLEVDLDGGGGQGNKAVVRALVAAVAKAAPRISGVRIVFRARDQWPAANALLEELAAAVKARQSAAVQEAVKPPPAPTDNLRIRSVRPLLPPACLLEELPRHSDHQTTVRAGREAVQRALSGESHRLVVLVGPPLVEDPAPFLEFASRVAQLRAEVGDELELVMRCGLVGIAGEEWSGMLKDPERDGSYQVNRGIRRGRDMLLRANRLGVPTAAYFTDTATPQYFADLLSFAAVSAQSEMLRELVSGLSMPAGLRTPTRGLAEATAALRSAGEAQRFFGVTTHGIAGIVRATGNSDCVVGLASAGEPIADFKAAAAAACADEAAPPLFVYTGGPGVGTEAQLGVVGAVAGLIEAGGAPALRGVVLDSYLLAGSRAPTPDTTLHGMSVSDDCLDWMDTARAIRQLATAVRKAAAAHEPGAKRPRAQ